MLSQNCKLTLIRPSCLQYVLPQNFFKVIPFKSISHHIALHVSTDMVTIRCLKFLFERTAVHSSLQLQTFIACGPVYALVYPILMSHSSCFVVFMLSRLCAGVPHSDGLFLLCCVCDPVYGLVYPILMSRCAGVSHSYVATLEYILSHST
jgi:hypothetical protein